MPLLGHSFEGNMRDWYDTLVLRLLDASNSIHKKIMIGAGNYLLISEDLFSIIRNCHHFKPTIVFPEEKPSNTQTTRATRFDGEIVGTLNNRLMVICNFNSHQDDNNKMRVCFYDLNDVLRARVTVIVQDMPNLDFLKSAI